MIPEKEDLVHWGKIVKLQGFKGEVVVSLLQTVHENSPRPEFVFVQLKDAIVPFFVEKLEVQNADTLLLKFEDVNSGDDVLKLHKAEVFIQKKDAGDGVWDKPNLKLISGFKVTDDVLGDLGVVDEIIELPGNPLLRVVKEGREILIPLNKDMVQNIDAKKKEVNVRVPEGLVDL